MNGMLLVLMLLTSPEAATNRGLCRVNAIVGKRQSLRSTPQQFAEYVHHFMKLERRESVFVDADYRRRAVKVGVILIECGNAVLIQLYPHRVIDVDLHRVPLAVGGLNYSGVIRHAETRVIRFRKSPQLACNRAPWR